MSLIFTRDSVSVKECDVFVNTVAVHTYVVITYLSPTVVEIDCSCL